MKGSNPSSSILGKGVCSIEYEKVTFLHLQFTVFSQLIYKFFSDFEPVSVRNKSFEVWEKEKLQDCIMHDDPQCILQDGETVDHPIVNKYFGMKQPIELEINYYSFQSYFCGQHPECVSFNSAPALQEAKANIDQLYPVVAVLERMDESIMLVEEKLNKVFQGLTKLYNRRKIY